MRIDEKGAAKCWKRTESTIWIAWRVSKKIETGSVKLVATDPPYFQGFTHNGQKGAFNDLAISRPFFAQLAQEFARILSEDGEFYIFCDWRGYAFYYPIFADYLPVRNMIVWDKMSGAGNFYRNTHELMIYGAVNSQTIRRETNVWTEKAFSSGARVSDGEKAHPTQKPLGIMQRIITNSSAPGDLVLDCFVGSGSTAVAAVKTGRRFIGFEIDERYFNIAQDRIARETKAAFLAPAT